MTFVKTKGLLTLKKEFTYQFCTLSIIKDRFQSNDCVAELELDSFRAHPLQFDAPVPPLVRYTSFYAPWHASPKYDMFGLTSRSRFYVSDGDSSAGFSNLRLPLDDVTAVGARRAYRSLDYVDRSAYLSLIHTFVAKFTGIYEPQLVQCSPKVKLCLVLYVYTYRQNFFLVLYTTIIPVLLLTSQLAASSKKTGL